jgi:hypothetical protein
MKPFDGVKRDKLFETLQSKNIYSGNKIKVNILSYLGYEIFYERKLFNKT